MLLNEGLVILRRAFQGTRIEELAVPSTLREYDTQAFCDCDSLKLVWVEDSRIVSLLPTGNSSVGVLKQSIRLGNVLLWDFRLQREVVIPEGAERIGRR